MPLCGASKAIINPQLPINLAACGSDVIAKRVHDDLHGLLEQV